ncbi:hypothetical protein [Ascidiimonas sp. W6]|uniref:hypothetical protein n=1 Tax=Ascidiimonas meishanensis TaxID=3128903 RepID=UPI0030EE91E6
MKVFTEIQKIPKWMYVLMIVGLISPLVIILSSYTKSNSESEKSELILVSILIICTEALAFWLISSMKQYVQINRNGIHFKYPPFKRKEVVIAMKNVESFAIQDYHIPSYGYKLGAWNILNSTPSITMIGLKKVIRVNYNNGKTILIGTQRPEEAVEIIKHYKLLENENY